VERLDREHWPDPDDDEELDDDPLPELPVRLDDEEPELPDVDSGESVSSVEVLLELDVGVEEEVDAEDEEVDVEDELPLMVRPVEDVKPE